MILLLSASVWFRGGMAFSPGRLSARVRTGTAFGGFTSHADFEMQCERCHQPVEVAQNLLCLDCHLTIAGQLTAQSGVHGKISPAAPCAACHPDHRGRDFSPALAALPYFDHSGADFSLAHHQFNDDLSPMACSACHVTESATFSADIQRCNTCHTERGADFMRQHTQDFGPACLACHDGHDGLAQFDHAATNFPLLGKHTSLTCLECHPGARPSPDIDLQATAPKGLFSGVSIACVDCHPLPSSHAGVFDPDCRACHTSAGWQPADLDGKQFDHESNTAFSLTHHRVDYQDRPMACSACHPGGFSSTDIGACSACHSGQDADFIQQHIAQYGSACLECHDGGDRMRGFDHQAVFPLEGAHLQIACLDCHKGGEFRSSASRCVDCHAEPAIHAGFFGLECQECHTSTAWSPAFLKVHTFPLDHGGGGQSACQTCHTASYVEYTCYGCHEHRPDEIAEKHIEDGVSPAELPNCTQCHPTGREKESEGD